MYSIPACPSASVPARQPPCWLMPVDVACCSLRLKRFMPYNGAWEHIGFAFGWASLLPDAVKASLGAMRDGAAAYFFGK